MKKITAILLALVMCFSFAACGGEDYSANEFDFLDETFSWSITVDDVQDIAFNNPVGGDKMVVDEHDTYTMVSCRGYKFRFGENGELEFVKLMFGESENKLMNMLVEAYGECAETNEDMGFYYWYGTLNGENTKLVLCIDSFSDSMNHIQLSPAK